MRRFRHPRSGWASRPALMTAALLMLVAVPRAGGAQTAPPSYEERLRSLFSGFVVDQPVQLMTPEILVEDARFRSLAPTTVELEQPGTGVPISVDLTAIRGVSVQRRHSIQGMLWGLGSGLLVGSVSGMLVASFDCRTVESCNSAERDGALRWGAVLGIVGGGLGFTLGHHDVYWKPVFP